MTIYLSTVFYLAVLLLSAFQPHEEGTLSVEVSNLRSDNGYVLISLFDNASAFPDKAENTVRKSQITIKDGKASVSFKGLKYGQYAIAVLHDENNNLKMDFNLVGVPKEGYGFSNNAKGTFGPPSFKKASFVIKKKTEKINIRASYILR
jgi:uncharacterized protein (DUF2141 family)